MRAVLLGIAVYLSAAPAGAEEPCAFAVKVAAVSASNCAAIWNMRALRELETDACARTVYDAAIDVRVDELLLKTERALVLESTKAHPDAAALGTMYRGLVFLRCADGVRVERDLTFLRWLFDRSR